VFKALIAYLDSLDPGSCPDGEEAIDADRNLTAAQTAYEIAQTQDTGVDTRVFYLRAARFELERIHERLPRPDQSGLRRELVKLSADLGVYAEAIRANQQVDAPAPDWTHLQSELRRAAGRSYYNPEVLRRALKAS
jgi:hypothetical protein